MKLKTIREHFRTLPILYRELAMGYALSEKEISLDDEVKTLDEAIWAGFIWLGTREGIDFWQAVSEDARFIESKRRKK